MKTLFIAAIAIVMALGSATAQGGPDLLHRYEYEWGRLGPFTFNVVTESVGTDTSRYLLLEWYETSRATKQSVMLTCAETKQAEAALEKMKPIQATTPELGNQYIFRAGGDSGLEIVLFSSANFGGGVSWRLGIDNTGDLITNSSINVAALNNLAAISNYFRDFNMNCH